MIGHLLLPSHNAYKTRLLLEQTRERAVEDAIGLDGQRMRAAPKAPLRKRPTPFPSAVHRSFFCPDCRFAFASFDRYVGACSGALPLPSVTPPASSSLACRPSAKPCRPARNGSTKSSTTATGSSAGWKAIAFACSPGAAMTTLIGCHGSWTPLLGFPHLPLPVEVTLLPFFWRL